jgi:ParB-like chromosome segregation protein Spo0J
MLEQLKEQITNYLSDLELDNKVSAINELRNCIHDLSPFKSEPVDLVLWVKNESVFANDYNPNSVAPPEMELLKLSIQADGYTQPIVSMVDSEDNSKREVIDGFHRNRVGKECKEIQEKVHGYLPVVTIRSVQTDKADRMASTVRHNRARGKHSVTSMSDIVIELKRRNWTNEKIAKHLGMESDEVLRLYQITSLSSIFKDKEFSMAWEPELIEENEEIIS